MSDSGKRKHVCWSIPTIPSFPRMVNKSMRCAVKVAGNTSTRLRSAAADEAKAVNGAGDKLPAVSSGADTHGDAPRGP